jgi:hypothetical protein
MFLHLLCHEISSHFPFKVFETELQLFEIGDRASKSFFVAEISSIAESGGKIESTRENVHSGFASLPNQLANVNGLKRSFPQLNSHQIRAKVITFNYDLSRDPSWTRLKF